MVTFCVLVIKWRVLDPDMFKAEQGNLLLEKHPCR